MNRNQASKSTQLVWQGCFFFRLSLATSTTNWVQHSTCLLFYAYVEIHQVRRLDFDNHQKCTIPLSLAYTFNNKSVKILVHQLFESGGKKKQWKSTHKFTAGKHSPYFRFLNQLLICSFLGCFKYSFLEYIFILEENV